MIGWLSGRLLRKQSSLLLVETGGIGYDVIIPFSTLFQVGDVGAKVSLFIHTNVREDALQLFGFATEAELGLFRQLITVNGIGPKLAVTILSGIPADELSHAIASGNVRRLTAVPGLGKKLAERILVELKDKVLPFATGADGAAGSAAGDPIREDALSALVNLGYRSKEAEHALDLVATELEAGRVNHELEPMLRAALRHLAR